MEDNMTDHMRSECLFCRIADQDIKSPLLYEDEDVVAFRDINPRAPLHILIIPRKHIPSLAELTPEDGFLVGKIALAAAQLAREEGVAEGGYRLVSNCRADGGQEVPHLHFHLLAGCFLGPYVDPEQ